MEIKAIEKKQKRYEKIILTLTEEEAMYLIEDLMRLEGGSSTRATSKGRKILNALLDLGLKEIL